MAVRECVGCGPRPVEDFWKKGKGLRSRCKSCHHYYRPKRPPLQSESEKRELRRDYNLRKRYGVTAVWYDSKLDEQGGVCAICLSPPGKKALHVDHDHETGRVRDLLCSSCNTILGHIENRALVEVLERYLERWKDG